MDAERIETRGEDGRRVLVFKYRTRIDTSDLDGESPIEGVTRYAVANGDSVNLDGEDFEIVATGEVLTRV